MRQQACLLILIMCMDFFYNARTDTPRVPGHDATAAQGRRRWRLSSKTPPLAALALGHSSDGFFGPSAWDQLQQAAASQSCVRLGRRFVHNTHKLFYRRGMYFCLRCASFGILRGLKLIQPCSGHLGKAGEYALNRVKAGLTPWPNLSFPLSEQDAPMAGVVA